MTLEVLESTRAVARNRGDEWGTAVLLRSENISDLVSTNARYHRQCQKNFVHPRKLPQPTQQSERSGSPAPPSARGRPIDEEKNAAFECLCTFMEESEECQYGLRELLQKMKELSPTSEPFSSKHLIRRLTERYGDSILVSTVGAGYDTTVCFTGAAAKLMHQNWYYERKKNPIEERQRIVAAAAEIVREDVRMQAHDMKSYPAARSMLDNVHSVVPDTLRTFLDGVVKVGKSGDLEVIDKRISFLSHSIIAATRPRTFISSLHLAVGVVLHRKFGSRYLIDLLHSLGVCSSYNEVLKYESSVTKFDLTEADVTAFYQFVFDNADCNVSTLDGHGTFHAMGGIRTITPVTSLIHRNTRVPRCEVTTTEIGRFAFMPLEQYEPGKRSGLETVKVKCFGPALGGQISLTAARLDALWLSAPYLRVANHPGWSGYMSAVTSSRTDFQTSFVEPVPFVNLQPSNPTTIYTCLLFAAKQCQKLQKPCIVTFDQPLFIKASNIALGSDENSPLRSVILRLGGFHMLMSFMGAVGYIMSGSGLEELWATVYAKNSVVHMMSGHAYARALRAHFLTQLAITVVFLQSEDMIGDHHLSLHLKDIFEKLLESKITLEEVSQSRLLSQIHETIEKRLDTEAEASRTGRLWVEYWRQVQIMRNFVRAERSGCWDLHLNCVQKMLPVFHAAGHLNYAKSAHLYLQSMIELSGKMSPEMFKTFTEEGFFTIRRTDKFWSGNWTDMTVEQTLMRYLSLKGGLFRGKRLSDATIAKWIKSLPAVTQIQEKLELFTGTSSGSSEQHVELRDTRQQRDHLDGEKFRLWLTQFSPFNKESHQLVSLCSGVVGNETVNCDEAVLHGLSSMQKSVGKTFADLQLHRKDKVVNLAVMGRAIKLRDEIVTINPNTLFHRIVCVVKTDEELSSCLAYELAPTPTSLFDGLSMRKGTKSATIKIFKDCVEKLASPKQVCFPKKPCFVLDGGHLLHKVIWPRPASFGTICEGYLRYIETHYGQKVTSERPTVVFDGYSNVSTKDEERLRRSAKAGCGDIAASNDIVTSVPSEKFFSNSSNKERFISLLSEHLKRANIQVIQADGDADRTIVATAVDLRKKNKHSVIVGEDTDLLILLVELSSNQEVFMLIPGRDRKPHTLFSSKVLKRALGEDCKDMLFFHAISGCDTTSAFFRKGKVQAFKAIKNSSSFMREKIAVFKRPDAAHDDIARAGETFMVRLYGGSYGQNLNELRFFCYQRAVAKHPLNARFDLAILPPTSSSARLHSYRVYHQVQAWLGRELDAKLWGWKLEGNVLRPVTSLEAPAPEALLSLISCNCKKGCEGRCPLSM